jgi:hypothetical protein
VACWPVLLHACDCHGCYQERGEVIVLSELPSQFADAAIVPGAGARCSVTFFVCTNKNDDSSEQALRYAVSARGGRGKGCRSGGGSPLQPREHTPWHSLARYGRDRTYRWQLVAPRGPARAAKTKTKTKTD